MLALNITSRFVVFYGENGAGKTNILEAISLFSPDRGLRRSPIADLNAIGSGALSWHLDLMINKNEYNIFLSTNANTGRRVAKIDNSAVPTLSKFEEIIWILWLVPSMDNLFINPISERRSFFDHLVSGHDKQHKQNLRKLLELQRERLHVIFHRKDEQWLAVLEEKMAEKNVAITKARLEFINLLHETFLKYPSDFLRPKVSVSGIVENIFLSRSEEDAVLEIAFMLKNKRYEDSEKQSTSVSVQKSHWHARHASSNLDAENCSTGEQKAFLISLVLAVVRIYQQKRSGTPILLLDDLMVHLDKTRRHSLLAELKSIDVQTFFTGTDIAFFENIMDVAQICRVKNSVCSVEQEISIMLALC